MAGATKQVDPARSQMVTLHVQPQLPSMVTGVMRMVFRVLFKPRITMAAGRHAQPMQSTTVAAGVGKITLPAAGLAEPARPPIRIPTATRHAAHLLQIMVTAGDTRTASPAGFLTPIQTITAVHRSVQ